MIYKNAALHNIETVLEHYDLGIQGGLLQRIPGDVWDNISPVGQMQMICPSGAEIRFVSDNYPVKITLEVDKIVAEDPLSFTEITVFYGTFQSNERFFIGRNPTTIEVNMPFNFVTHTRRVADSFPFSPRVCRVKFWGPGLGRPMRLHDISCDGNIRPPREDEVPSLRYLAYGSSLTQGAFASAQQIAYIYQVGHRLGADVINLGSSCSAYCEKEMADHIASRDDWDFATLTLSVNMVGLFSHKEFSKRVEYMIQTVGSANTDRPVACITIKPYYGYFKNNAKPEEYREILREKVATCGLSNVYLLEGPDLLPHVPGGFNTDFIHYSDHGMIQIGELLSKTLKPILIKHGLIENSAGDTRNN